MNGDKNTSKELQNKWLVCKSQSRPGVSYYFNSVTGESVWDLSEIEKAKATEYTKTLPATSLKNCREPKVPPKVTSSGLSTVVHNQTVGNQFCRHSEMNPHGTPGGNAFPPNIWSSPPNGSVIPGTIPGQYILVPSTLLPTVAPIIAQPDINYGTAQQNYYQASHSMGQQHEYHQSHTKPQRRHNYPQRGYNKRGRGINRQNSRPNNNTFNNAPDLRTKLIQKRRKSQSFNTDNWEDSRSIEYDKVQKNNWEETSSKYDLSKVKQLNSNPERRNWFVVVDIDILVNEFKFLDRFTNPDQSCYLLVPEHVMCELQARAAGLDDKVKRIKRFLTEQMDLNYAFKGEDVSERAQDDCDKTFATCLDWAEQDNVILLSNDTKFYRYKGASQYVHVLTMSDLLYILSHGPSRQETIDEKSLSLKESKVIVPNDNTQVKVVEQLVKAPTPEKNKDVVRKVPVKESSPEPVKASTSQNVMENVIFASKQNVMENVNFASKQNVMENVNFASKQNVMENVIVASKQNVMENDIVASKQNVMENDIVASKQNVMENDIVASKQNVMEKVIVASKQNVMENDIVASKQNDTSLKSKAPQVTVSSGSSAQINSVDGKKKIKLRRWHRTKPTPVDPSPVPNRTQDSPQKKDDTLEEKPLEISIQTEPVVNHDESSKSSTKTNNSTHSRRLKMRREVMYEIESENMKEVLRVRRDEWVIQFVQIMEDVLRLKLSGNSGLNLHEAVKCVIQKYINDVNVVDAANKLSYILHEIRDDTGNIKSNIDPYEYMEMYSYGMYLIETLKDVSNNCEDLNTAHESLNKLLSDIKNTNLDNSQDSFMETDHHGEENVRQSMVEADTFNKHSSPTKIPIEDQNYIQSNADYSSFTGTLAKEQATESQQKCAENETSFFSNLKLRKKFQDTKLLESQDLSDNDDNSNERRLPLSPKSPTTSPHIDEGQESKSETLNISNVNQNASIRIARNFVCIPKYEQQFRNKLSPEKNRDKSIQDAEIEEKQQYASVKESIHEETIDNSEKLDETKITDDNFKTFINRFFGEVRGMLQNVIILCSNTIKELDNEDQGKGSSTSIDFDKFEKTDNSLAELTETLTSILDRNNNYPRKNLWQQDPNMADYMPSDAIVAQYSETIKGLKKQVALIRNTINLILKLATKK